MPDSEFREYENGVADVLASIAGPEVEVERNVILQGKSGTSRQIDVLVRGQIFGFADATLIADCKRWRNTVDIKDVEGFAGMTEDVNAEFGILVSASASSANAKSRAKLVRGMRLVTLSVLELAAWRPKGTVCHGIRIAVPDFENAARVLRNSGLRVAEDKSWPSEDGTVVIETFRHYGFISPSVEVQAGQRELIDLSLNKAAIDFTHVSHGIICSGGTPAHRWMKILHNSVELPFKILAATEEDIDSQLEHFAPALGLPVGELDVSRPEGWPYSTPFDV